MEEYLAIFKTELSEAEKIARAYDWVTGRMVEHAEHEIELLRAMGDREAMVKEQIKLGVIRHTRGVFAEAYKLATGRRAWDE